MQTDTQPGSTTDDQPHAEVEYLDVVVVGAGLSGIGAAYRLQTECPGLDYAVLESRESMGGTWDLFRYPGVRSDSDMFTLGYQFKPWQDPKALADGPSILRYIRDTADEFGIADKIRYGTKVISADFSTEHARWTLTLERGGERTLLRCGFLYACSGYYDYAEPHTAGLPGIDQFAGEVVHPQFWPENFDHDGRRIVVIGSGATAVTLVPAMADTAEHVTMLQRSPTWISAVPSRDKFADRVRKLLPAPLAHRVARTKNIAFSIGFYQFCQRQPQRARTLLTGLASKILGDEQLVADHFTPTYNPWDQRLCAVPDADFFKAVKAGDAEVVTDRIDTFVPEGIRLRSGRVLPADTVVTATGLRLLAFGGIALHVDGAPVDLADQFVWRGAMLTSVPNFAFCVGYTNASWTLRADLSSRLVCRVLNHLERHQLAAAVPRAEKNLTERPLLDLASGYVQRSIGDFPKQGDRGPWRVRQNYLLDAVSTLFGTLTRTLEVTPRSRVRAAGAAADPAPAGAGFSSPAAG